MNMEMAYLMWLSRWNKLRFSLLKRRLKKHFAFGPECDIYPEGIFFQGQGRVIFEEGCIIERGGFAANFWVEGGASIRFGPRAWLRGRYQPNVFSLAPGSVVDIGPDSLLTGVTISVKKGVKIGRNFLGGFGSRILDSDFHDLDESTPEQTAAVTIGDHVWLASDATVLKGVSIADHCVIGAGSLVTQDIPPNTFAAGRPAKPIKRIGNRTGAK